MINFAVVYRNVDYLNISNNNLRELRNHKIKTFIKFTVSTKEKQYYMKRLYNLSTWALRMNI